jgi:hypothetical protein
MRAIARAIWDEDGFLGHDRMSQIYISPSPSGKVAFSRGKRRPILSVMR